VTHQVVITNPPPAPAITGPLFICQNNVFPSTYYGPAGYDGYQWTGTNTTPGSGNSESFEVSFTGFPATINLMITDSNGCTNSSQITVDTLPLTVINLN